MIFWWMGYAAGIGVLLAVGGWAGERLCETMGWPRRFAWIAALTLAVVIPLAAQPPAPVLDVSAAAPSPITSVVQAADPAVPAISGTGWERAAIVAWGAASLATLLVFGAILGLMNHSRRRWPRRSVDGEDVYVSEGFGPALIGVTRPSVVIPDWLLCAGDRAGRVAILHEREHARAGDHLTLLYGAVIAALFPWSPAVWWMVRNLRGAVEIDCDRRVIASGIPADDYGKLLLAIGVGRHRRWVLTPALLESRHSLERRLKIMAARKMKWSPLRAVTLAGLTVAALVVACDTNAPTALDDALLDVLANPEAEVSADGSLTPQARAEQVEAARQAAAERLGSYNVRPRPLIFIDGMEVSNSNLSLEAGQYTVKTDPYSPLTSLNPDDIERIEVIKGSAATDLFGDWAENGVIQIFTKEADASDPAEPSASSSPPEEGGDVDEVKPIDIAYYVQLGSPAFVLRTNKLSLVP
ncbi:MAG: TonB-dependent receptor plug domain-containing protein [Gammaproteobacteria bacterium]|nr:TonB-dependent receptor plug domain-containing protein [Gammaproteobacteria bacterium]MYC53316.1 TonB-dependent receptor plug domain-containing protein [Gammaproteobacteria bacterium]